MVWTAPRTWIAGGKPPASVLNEHIRDNLIALNYRPRSSRYLTGTPSTSNGVEFLVDFNNLNNAADDGISYSAGTFTLPQVGIYLVNAVVSWAANSGGTRAAIIYQAGTSRRFVEIPGANVTMGVQATATILVTAVSGGGADNTVQIKGLQTAGSLNLNGGAVRRTACDITFMGGQ